MNVKETLTMVDYAMTQAKRVVSNNSQEIGMEVDFIAALVEVIVRNTTMSKEDIGVMRKSLVASMIGNNVSNVVMYICCFVCTYMDSVNTWKGSK